MALVLILTLGKVHAQVTISGPSCATVGTPAIYYLSGTYSPPTNWTVNGGVITEIISGSSTATLPNSYVPGSATMVKVKWTQSTGCTLKINSNTPQTFSVADAFSKGAITVNKTQTIAYYTVPSSITCPAASGGSCSPSFTYQWEKSTNTVDWQVISGATGLNLSFTSQVVVPTYYRRKVHTASNTDDYSDTATVFVNEPFARTTIYSSQEIFTDNTPATITGAAVPAGNCSGTITYLWQYSTDGNTWTDMNGTNWPGMTVTTTSLAFNPGQTLAQSTWFRRMDKCVATTTQYSFSNVVKLGVNAHLTTPAIATSTSTVNYGTSPSITLTPSTGGICGGYPTYDWQLSTDGTNFSSIGTGQGFTPGKLTLKSYYRVVTTCGSETQTSNVLTINVNPQLFEGTITPSMITITSGTSPGQLSASAASGGACSGVYAYQWESSTTADFTSVIAISGATAQNYTPGAITGTTYFRRKVTCNGEVKYTNTAVVSVTAPTTYNYITERTILKPAVTDITAANALTSVADVQQVKQYFDGLGRVIQTVGRQASPLGKDMVTVNTYDEFGRELVKYLPYVATTNTGTYKATPLTEQNTFNTAMFAGENTFYSRTDVEASPLNRPLAAYAQGGSWGGAGRGIESAHWLNTTIDDVKIWTVTNSGSLGTFGSYTVAGVYSAGSLFKEVAEDENGKQVITFKDEDGKIILKKVQLTATADDGAGSVYPGWLCTYYVYDYLDQLRAVVQPRGVELLIQNSWNISALSGDILKEQCFRYEYDERGRMIMKKVPGADEVYMVYDKRDRLVFTQDAKMRPQNQWMYTLYDDINRPVQTGIMVYTGGWGPLVTSVNGLAGTTATTSISGSNVDAISPVLTINTREAGINPYNATQEIDFNDGFQSETGAEFVAEIVTASGGSFGGTQTVNTNAIPAGVTPVALTYTFYDDYSFTGKSYNAVDNSKLDAGTNPYAETQPTATMIRTLGIATGARVRLLDPVGLSVGKWMETATFYDEKLRVVQVQAVNVTGGTDVTTMQYDFSGKVLSNNITHQKLNGAAATYLVSTRITYDNGGRVTKTEKKINTGSWKTITVLTYNELNQLKTKKLGTDPVTTANPLETLNYDYNIRGWMLGMNRDYAKTPSSTSNYFGFDLGYDKTDIKPGSGSSIGSFTTAAYSGNITGIVWKSTGDNKVRRYDFTYDAINRLTGANFTQYSSNNVFELNANDNIDFTVSNLSYDANGNITRQTQKGWKPGGAFTLDDLYYKYYGNSNKLRSVIDDANDKTTTLGDFRTSASYLTDLGGIANKDKTKADNFYTDYTYDVNGNLGLDQNKDISAIVYNILNLPQTITVKYKGTIQYIYDAAGNKLKKIVQETGKPVKTTLYLFGIYQDDALQLLPQEEGRIRKKDDGSFVYDYFLKDHLGNTRMVLTEEQQTDPYPLASLETGTLNNEKMYYSGLDNGRTAISGVAGYPANDNTNSPGPNAYTQKLNGGGTKIGAGILLKVMAGDALNVRVNSWYKTNGLTPSNGATPLTDIVNALVTANTNIPGLSGGKMTAAQLSGTTLTPSITGANGFITKRDVNYQTARPKAYLNIVVLDEQLNPVITNDGKNSIFEQVPVESVYNNGTTPTVYQHIKSNVPITKNGYVYVYVSNETQNIDVYFDNLQVTQVRGRILEETHYYPFGLTMAGISSKSAGKLQNRFKFNDATELNEDLGINFYETDFRSYDLQLGRFHQIDPLAEDFDGWSPYAFAYNDPMYWNDPLGAENLSWQDILKQIEGGTIKSGLYFHTGDGSTFDYSPATFFFDKERKKLHAWTDPTYTTIEHKEDDGTEWVEGNYTTGKHYTTDVPDEYLPYEESGWDYVPVVGDTKKAADEFKKGRWGWGLLHSALAISDLFAVKAAITAVGKVAIKGATSTFVALINRETKVYRIMNNITGEVHKFGIASKPLFGSYVRMERQLAKLGGNFSGKYVATFSGRSAALDFERYLVTLYRFNGPTGQNPVGNLLPLLKHWLFK